MLTPTYEFTIFILHMCYLIGLTSKHTNFKNKIKLIIINTKQQFSLFLQTITKMYFTFLYLKPGNMFPLMFLAIMLT